MYGAKVTVVSGAALLPATGNNRLLFIVAASLIVAGVIVGAISYIRSRAAN